MKYFLHDSNAFNDEKITELFMQFGYEGLGLFYTVLEKIAGQEKPVKTSVLKSQLKVGKRLEKCWSFMESLGIISSNNGETFNERILSYSEMYQIKKEKNKEKISQWREKQSVIENVTSYEPVRNHDKVKISKVKVYKDIISDKSLSQTFKNFTENDFLEDIKKNKGNTERDTLNNFFLYWKEKSAGGKMRFQLEKTWETKLRLSNWNNNQHKFEKNGSAKKFDNVGGGGIKQRDLGANQLLERGKKLFDTYTGGEKDN